ncbi:hypothetical protein M0R45_019072 [Rubus argutus]|uniref:Uncharacterized protein n=1 Tax=Rubus argutus TaxID=59490 RepID=A0AAW1X4F6_RUBAR
MKCAHAPNCLFFSGKCFLLAGVGARRLLTSLAPHYACMWVWCSGVIGNYSLWKYLLATLFISLLARVSIFYYMYHNIMATSPAICPWSFLEDGVSVHRSFASVVTPATFPTADLPTPVVQDGKTTVIISEDGYQSGLDV